jgi:hypothetical protein
MRVLLSGMWGGADDYASKVDQICCGASGSRCPGNAPPTGKCTAACAVAVHAFTTDCQQTLQVVMPGATNPRRLGILRFESGCIKSTDPKFFLKAIMNAKCPKNVHKVPPPPPTPPPPPPPPAAKAASMCTHLQHAVMISCAGKCSDTKYHHRHIIILMIRNLDGLRFAYVVRCRY